MSVLRLFSPCLVPFISILSPFRPSLLHAMSADLYPQSAYSARPSYQQRADQPYQLSTPSSVVYPPQLLSSQQQQPQQPQTSSLSDAQSAHSNEAHSQSPQRESQSPKQEDNASIPKQEGAPQQQPAKPQATFLTKLYAYVLFDASRYMRALMLTSNQGSSNGQRTTT